MSGLLRLLSSGLLIVLLSFQFVNSFEVEAEPSAISFSGNLGDRECKSINIFSDSKKLLIEDRWSEFYSRNVGDFVYSSQEMGIEIEKPSFVDKGENSVKICVKREDRYRYLGVLIFYPEDYGAGLGVWIEVGKGNIKQASVRRENRTIRQLGISGDVIAEQGGGSVETLLDRGKIVLFELVSLAILAIILLFILYRKLIR